MDVGLTVPAMVLIAPVMVCATIIAVHNVQLIAPVMVKEVGVDAGNYVPLPLVNATIIAVGRCHQQSVYVQHQSAIQ